MSLVGVNGLGVALLAVAAAGGFYAGSVWQAHRHDAADLKAARSQLDATQQALDQSQTDWQRAVDQFRKDSAHLSAIAEVYAHDRETRTRYFGILNDRLDAALVAHPAAADCDIGVDGLRVWNDANRGEDPAAGHAATRGRRGAAAAVPGTAAREKRSAARPATQSSAGDGGLPRLRRQAPANHPGGEDVGSDASRARGVIGASRLALIDTTGD